MPPGITIFPTASISLTPGPIGTAPLEATATIFSPEIVKAFHKLCQGFRGSNDGTPIPPCMGYRIEADENPFGTGAKDEL